MARYTGLLEDFISIGNALFLSAKLPVVTKEEPVHVRQEQPDDFPAIYELVRSAFALAPTKDGDEQDYVVSLRNSRKYVPRLALVAEEGGRIIGHILLTRTSLEKGMSDSEELLLSPVSVAPKHQRKGVGGALIREALRIARNLGYAAVFLCGEPEIYRRFGFRPASEFRIVNRGVAPSDKVLACELYPGALNASAGFIAIV